MVPRYLRFVEDLPRNSLNKIEKFKLKEEANRDLSVYWDREQAGIVIKR
jgi:crotonobetaine/carnitine-CoA ligase